MANPGMSQAYAFTVTIHPRHYKNIAEVQYETTYKALLLALLPQCLLTLVCELTKNANVHYHGVLKVPLHKYKDVNKWFRDLFRGSKLFGFVNLTPITDEAGWFAYLTKDLAHTSKVMSRRPILRDDLNLFTEDLRASYANMW